MSVNPTFRFAIFAESLAGRSAPCVSGQAGRWIRGETMHKHVFAKTAPRVVCAMAVLFVSGGAFGQVQRTETGAETRLSSFEPRPSGGGLAGMVSVLHESAKLTASDAAAGDNFGFSVSLSGDTAVVGAYRDDCAAGDYCGSAYAFRFDGTDWVEEQKLTASDALAGDGFGVSVSLSGDTAVVGAPWDDCAAGNRCGLAYVYRFNGTSWVEQQMLTASDAAEGDEFGESVSLSGDTAVVGASQDDCTAGTWCGSAYVFRFNGTSWAEEQKLTATDSDAFYGFGTSVSLSGDTAVVGAMRHGCAAGGGCGAAYVFRFNGTGWVEEQMLTASDPGPYDNFGFSVSLSGDTAVVGTPNDNCATGDRCGSAYVFRFDGTIWIEEQKLTASDPGPSDRFGSFVSLSGDTAVVGAPIDNCPAGSACGSAYVFRFDGTDWVEEQKLTTSDAGPIERFGNSVSVSGGTAVVGAMWDHCAAGSACGSAYVFDLGPGELEVAIDIKPGSDTNPINLGAMGVLPVAVLTTVVADGDLADFDAANVDPSSLTLAGAAPRTRGRSGRTETFEDVDGDGDLDLVVHFPIAELDLTDQDTEAVLVGQTLDGTPIRGSDTITVQ